MSSITRKQLNIIIAESGSENTLKRLQASAEKLEKSIEKGTKAGKDMTAELNRLENVKGKINSLEGVISGRLSPSLTQAKAAATNLHRELRDMSQDMPGYAAKFDQFKQVSSTVTQMEGRFKSFRTTANSVWKDIKSVALGVTVGNTLTAVTTAITGFINSSVTNAAKLSDELSDIEKAADMTTFQVNKLNNELGKINTRTARSELREIAISLGQAGEAVNAANVEALDQINVALGDEFGGNSREIGNVLSVLRNNLQDIKTGNYAQDITHIGNALNELGAKGLATAPVVTDIANRIAGVAQTFNVSSGEILGIAASFQELGINTERGSTAYIKLLQRMASDTEAFAAVAGMALQEFQDLVNEDINTALLKVAEGSREAANSNTAFAKILDDLNAEGAGVSEMLSKLAANGDLVREKIDLATGALKENTSIMNEFEKKNTNLAAQYEKLQKNIAAAFNSSAMRRETTAIIGELNKLFDETNRASLAFQEAEKQFKSTTDAVEPLYTRYLELKNRTALNVDEHNELRKIINQIIELVPQAASEFDEYGNAIDINTLKLGIWREEQKKFLQDLNRKAIESMVDDIETSLDRLPRLLERRNVAIRAKNIEAVKVFDTNIAKAREVALRTAEELSQKYGYDLPADIQVAIDKIREQIGELRMFTEGYDGGGKVGSFTLNEAPDWQQQFGNNESPTDLAEQKRREEAAKKAQTEARRRADEARREAERRRRELMQLLKEISGIEQEITLNNMDPYLKRLNQIGIRFSELMTRAGQDAQLRERILRAMLGEAQQLNADFQKELDKAILQPPPAPLEDPEYIPKLVSLQTIAQERIAKLQLDAEQKTGIARRDAQKKLLNQQMEDEITLLKRSAIERGESELDIQNQIKLIRHRYMQEQAEEDENYLNELGNRVADYISIFQSSFEAYRGLMNALDQSRLDKVEASYNRERRALDTMLSEKLISQKSYNRQIAALEEKAQQEKSAIAKREHKRNQVASIAQIAIDSITAGIKLWAKPGFPANLGLLTLLALQTAAGIGAVLATPPPQYEQGGLVPEGPSHRQGGIALVSRGRKIGEMEGGEPIISKRVYQSNKPLIDTLIYKGQNRDFTPLNMNWMATRPAAINFTRLQHAYTPRFETGGISPQPDTTESNMGNELLLALLRKLEEPAQAYVVYSDIEAKGNQINSIKRNGMIG